MQHQSSETIDLNFVTEEETLEAKFSTLNLWRKIYLVLLWVEDNKNKAGIADSGAIASP